MFFARKPAVSSGSLTYLGEKCEVNGDIHLEGNLRVDGIVHGNVEVLGDMEVSHTGLVEGLEIHARNLIIHGVVKARLIVDGKLSVSKTARLEGDVTAGAIDIEGGAFYTGHMATTDAKSLPGTGRLPELIGREQTGGLGG